MNLIKVICIHEKECLNKKTSQCNVCSRNVNRQRIDDRFKRMGNWITDEIINNIRK